MTYFTRSDLLALASATANSTTADTELQRVYDRLFRLHHALHPRLRKAGIELYANVSKQGEVGFSSSSTPFATELMTLTYTRSHNQSRIIENIMGRDGSEEIDTRCHPVIEVRLTQDHIAIELVLAPEAWHDQQNLAGKLTVDAQRTALYELLATLEGNYALGFWSGAYLDEDMHLTTESLPPEYIFHQWMDTFAAGRDWFRLGIWYKVEDDAIHSDNIVTELLNRIRELNRIYNFIAWNSNNDFHRFYQRNLVKARR